MYTRRDFVFCWEWNFRGFVLDKLDLFAKSQRQLVEKKMMPEWTHAPE